MGAFLPLQSYSQRFARCVLFSKAVRVAGGSQFAGSGFGEASEVLVSAHAD
jgi:hypothetical protein